MDIGSLLGLFLAISIIVGAAYHQTHGNLMAFYSTEGVLLVIVGAICGTMISLPLKNFLGIPGVLMKCIPLQRGGVG